MEIPHARKFLTAILSVFLAFAGVGHSALTIEDFSLDSSTVSFNISGTVSGPDPEVGRMLIYFVNSNLSTPRFVLPVWFESPISHTWTGTQILNEGYPLFTGNSAIGDYFGVYFESDLMTEEVVNGSFAATFPPGTFDPTAASSIDVIWGESYTGEFSGGVIQDVVTTVPEPSTVTIIALLSCGLVSRRLRN